jgi:hypothetical protein
MPTDLESALDAMRLLLQFKAQKLDEQRAGDYRSYIGAEGKRVDLDTLKEGLGILEATGGGVPSPEIRAIMGRLGMGEYPSTTIPGEPARTINPAGGEPRPPGSALMEMGFGGAGAGTAPESSYRAAPELTTAAIPEKKEPKEYTSKDVREALAGALGEQAKIALRLQAASTASPSQLAALAKKPVLADALRSYEGNLGKGLNPMQALQSLPVHQRNAIITDSGELSEARQWSAKELVKVKKSYYGLASQRLSVYSKMIDERVKQIQKTGGAADDLKSAKVKLSALLAKLKTIETKDRVAMFADPATLEELEGVNAQIDQVIGGLELDTESAGPGEEGDVDLDLGF